MLARYGVENSRLGRVNNGQEANQNGEGAGLVGLKLRKEHRNTGLLLNCDELVRVSMRKRRVETVSIISEDHGNGVQIRSPF